MIIWIFLSSFSVLQKLGLQWYICSQYDKYLDTSATIRCTIWYIISYNWQVMQFYLTVVPTRFFLPLSARKKFLQSEVVMTMFLLTGTQDYVCWKLIIRTVLYACICIAPQRICDQKRSKDETFLSLFLINRYKGLSRGRGVVKNSNFWMSTRNINCFAILQYVNQLISTFET